MPLAVQWPARFSGPRIIDDSISFIDLAPTFLEAAGPKPSPEMTGRSLLPMLVGNKKGTVEPDRKYRKWSDAFVDWERGCGSVL